MPDQFAVSKDEDGMFAKGMRVEERGTLRLPILGTIGDALQSSRPDVRLIPMSAALVKQLELDPTALRLLAPRQFEEFIANRLDRMGFDVSFTGRVNQSDGGIDLVALPKKSLFGAPLIAVQVKHRSKGGAVGRSDVDRLLAWKNKPFHLGLLVTNGRITRDAFWAATQPGNKEWARLRAFEDVKRWIENNFDRELEARELPTAIEIRPGIWVPVPRGGCLSDSEVRTPSMIAIKP